MVSTWVCERTRRVLTISMAFHSLLRILLMSPVRIIWFAAEICGRRFRAKIMNAFMGRLGVPSGFRVCDVSARCGSSGGGRDASQHWVHESAVRAYLVSRGRRCLQAHSQ